MNQFIKVQQKSHWKIISNIPENRLGNNQIRTTKYNIITFLPLVLFQFLIKFQNIYFVSIMILQCIKQISLSNGQPTFTVGLAINFSIFAIKEIYYQRKRYLKDKQDNNQKCYKLQNREFVKVKRKELVPGNIIKLMEQSEVPADCVALKSSSRQIYLFTKNLDGETSISKKQLHSNFDRLKNQNIQTLYMMFHADQPDGQLSSFRAKVIYDSDPFSINIKNFIPRGSIIKITKEIFAVVIYTGMKTKLMNKKNKFKIKSTFFNYLSRRIIFVLIILIFILTGTAALIYVVSSTEILYIGQLKNKNFVSFIIFYGTWILHLNGIIPISVFTLLQLIRGLVSYLIEKQQNLRSKENNIPLQIQNYNACEELGRIQHIISDKTGTLTRNIMNITGFLAGNQAYAFGYQDNFGQYIQYKNLNEMQDILKTGYENQKLIKHLILNILTNHSVFIIKDKDQNKFNGISSQQLQTLRFLKQMNIQLFEMDNNQYYNFLFHKQNYSCRLIYKIDYTSERRRMSVIVEHQNNLILYSKGADNTIYQLLTEQQKLKYDQHLQQINIYLEKGFRILVYAMKIITQEVYEQYKQKSNQIGLSSSTNMIHQLQQLDKQMQNGLSFIGVVAIYDQLQPQIKSSIELFRERNIETSVLTGDKLQTAIMSSKTSSILPQYRKIKHLSQILQEQQQQLKFDDTIQNTQYSLILEGIEFQVIEQQKLIRLLSDKKKNIKNVIGYRFSPAQKSRYTNLISNKMYRVLAIGDGANDTGMIMNANVGVGILGKQGSQAARAADIVVGQFCIIRQLVLVQGIQLYRRFTTVFVYMIYKNGFFKLITFWYGTISVFSGSIIFDQWLLMFYNFFFTSLPNLIYCISDTQYTRQQKLRDKSIFIREKNNIILDFKYLFKQLLASILISLYLMWILYFLYQSHLINTGFLFQLEQTGSLLFFVIVIHANVKIYIFLNTHNIALLVSILIGILSYVPTYYLLEIILQIDNPISRVLQNYLSYSFILFLSITAYLIEFCINIIYNKQKLKIYSSKCHIKNRKIQNNQNQ